MHTTDGRHAINVGHTYIDMIWDDACVSTIVISQEAGSIQLPPRYILLDPALITRYHLRLRDRGCTTHESKPNGAGDMGAVVD